MIHIELHGPVDFIAAAVGLALIALWIHRSIHNSQLLSRIEREANEVFFYEGDADKLAQSLHRIGHAIEPGSWPEPPEGEAL